jgi:hypothetical protein
MLAPLSLSLDTGHRGSVEQRAMQSVLIVNFRDGVPGCLLDRAFRQLGSFRAVAANGTLYTNAYATDPDPARALAGAMAGRQDGGRVGGVDFDLDGAIAHQGLLTGLRAQGYTVEVNEPGGEAGGVADLATLGSLARGATEAAALIRAWGAPSEVDGPRPALLVQVSNGRDAQRVCHRRFAAPAPWRSGRTGSFSPIPVGRVDIAPVAGLVPHPEVGAVPEPVHPLPGKCPLPMGSSVLERDMCYAPQVDMGCYLSASTLGDDAASGSGHGANVPTARAMALLGARALGSRAAHLDDPAEHAARVHEALCVHSAAWRSLRACDALLAQLLQALRDCAQSEGTLVIVTATCGVSLREHGHGADVVPWDASMRTFLAICPTDAGAPRGDRCAAPLPLAALTELVLWHSDPDRRRDPPGDPAPWPLGSADAAAAALWIPSRLPCPAAQAPLTAALAFPGLCVRVVAQLGSAVRFSMVIWFPLDLVGTTAFGDAFRELSSVARRDQLLAARDLPLPLSGGLTGLCLAGCVVQAYDLLADPEEVHNMAAAARWNECQPAEDWKARFDRATLAQLGAFQLRDETIVALAGLAGTAAGLPLSARGRDVETSPDAGPHTGVDAGVDNVDSQHTAVAARVGMTLPSATTTLALVMGETNATALLALAPSTTAPGALTLCHVDGADYTGPWPPAVPRPRLGAPPLGAWRGELWSDGIRVVRPAEGSWTYAGRSVVAEQLCDMGGVLVVLLTLRDVGPGNGLRPLRANSAAGFTPSASATASIATAAVAVAHFPAPGAARGKGGGGFRRAR